MTIWLDVTTILAWHRPAVGVVHVETELAHFFLQKDPSHYQFCRFEKFRNACYPVSRNEVYEKLDYLADLRGSFEDSGQRLVQMADANGSSEYPGRRRMFNLHPLVDRLITAIKASFVNLIIATFKGIYAVKGYCATQGPKATLPGL